MQTILCLTYDISENKGIAQTMLTFKPHSLVNNRHHRTRARLDVPDIMLIQSIQTMSEQCWDIYDLPLLALISEVYDDVFSREIAAWRVIIMTCQCLVLYCHCWHVLWLLLNSAHYSPFRGYCCYMRHNQKGGHYDKEQHVCICGVTSHTSLVFYFIYLTTSGVMSENTPPLILRFHSLLVYRWSVYNHYITYTCYWTNMPVLISSQLVFLWQINIRVTFLNID